MNTGFYRPLVLFTIAFHCCTYGASMDFNNIKCRILENEKNLEKNSPHYRPVEWHMLGNPYFPQKTQLKNEKSLRKTVSLPSGTTEEQWAQKNSVAPTCSSEDSCEALKAWSFLRGRVEDMNVVRLIGDYVSGDLVGPTLIKAQASHRIDYAIKWRGKSRSIFIVMRKMPKASIWLEARPRASFLKEIESSACVAFLQDKEPPHSRHAHQVPRINRKELPKMVICEFSLDTLEPVGEYAVDQEPQISSWEYMGPHRNTVKLFPPGNEHITRTPEEVIFVSDDYVSSFGEFRTSVHQQDIIHHTCYEDTLISQERGLPSVHVRVHHSGGAVSVFYYDHASFVLKETLKGISQEKVPPVSASSVLPHARDNYAEPFSAAAPLHMSKEIFPETARPAIISAARSAVALQVPAIEQPAVLTLQASSSTRLQRLVNWAQHNPVKTVAGLGAALFGAKKLVDWYKR